MSLHLLSLRYSEFHASRLDDFLAQTLPEEFRQIGEPATVSKSKIRRLIIAGSVSMNGKPIRNPTENISRGSRILIRLDTEKFAYEKKPDDIVFEVSKESVLYEDDAIIVVNKPAGIPTEATIVASRDHLHAAVQRYLSRNDESGSGDVNAYAGLHHRLDRETSGVVLFTKNHEVNAAVHRMFLKHTARKEYEALSARPVILPETEFFVENCIGRISPKSAAAKWGPLETGGEPARTNFTLLEEHSAFLRIAAMPITGRTHQIRVHLAGCGMPLLGDTLYGGPSAIAIETRESDDSRHAAEKTTPQGIILGAAAFRRKPAGAQENASSTIMTEIPRIMLHASRLTFPHPVTGTEMSVSAPLPADFRQFVATHG